MKNSCVDAIYRKMHPAIGNIGILYWHEICSGSETAPLYIWGDQNSCELFVQRFENNGVSDDVTKFWLTDEWVTRFVSFSN